MDKWNSGYAHYCHWCNRPYKSKKPIGQSRFGSARCKQAHHRAYKKYVTAKTSKSAAAAGQGVTRKKRKKHAKN